MNKEWDYYWICEWLFICMAAFSVCGMIAAICFNGFPNRWLFAIMWIIPLCTSIWGYKSSYFRGRRFFEAKRILSESIAKYNEIIDHMQDQKDLVKQIFTELNTKVQPEYDDKGTLICTCKCPIELFPMLQQDARPYICDYFGIDSTEENMKRLYTIGNISEEVEASAPEFQSAFVLVYTGILANVPQLISYLFRKELFNALGMRPVTHKANVTPQYVFQSKESKRIECRIRMDSNSTTSLIGHLLMTIDKN